MLVYKAWTLDHSKIEAGRAHPRRIGTLAGSELRSLCVLERVARAAGRQLRRTASDAPFPPQCSF
jgi:hypothetical protein